MMSKLRVASGAVALLALASAAATCAAAQNWPTRTVKFIVPLGPSSGADITARLLADRLQTKWGHPVVVENRAGGDGLVGITAFLSANDDHTLFFGPTASYTAHPWTRTSIPYNAKDIIPIVRTTVTVVAISVPTSLGINSLKELVDAARKQPGKMNWAAVTGLNDFQFGAFVKTSGVDIVRVPYRDLNQAVNDLGENRIQVYSSAFATVRPATESGKVKPIALNNSRRFETILPGVPTAREEGFPVLEFDGLVGIHGMPNVQQSVRKKISDDVIEILKDPKIAERLTAGGTAVVPGDTEEFTKAIEAQRQTAATTGKLLGLKPVQE
jgi:tripartite-type tricarboxylate transporter receptor subunit TctC